MFGRILFVAYTLVSIYVKDYGRKAVETMMRYMLPSKSEERIQFSYLLVTWTTPLHTFYFEDYSPMELSEIVSNKLLQRKVRIPYGIERIVADYFSKMPKSTRSELTASLCDDLITEVRFCQESRLTFDASYNDLVKYTKEDFVNGMKMLLTNKLEENEQQKDAMTQTPMEVTLHIPGVGLIPCSPIAW